MQGPGERNYHIFGMMFAGMDEAARNLYRLTKYEDYRYMIARRANTNTVLFFSLVVGAGLLPKQYCRTYKAEGSQDVNLPAVVGRLIHLGSPVLGTPHTHTRPFRYLPEEKGDEQQLLDEWKELVQAFKDCGFSEQETDEQNSVLAAVLLLGNLDFQDGDRGDAAVVSDNAVRKQNSRCLV